MALHVVKCMRACALYVCGWMGGWLLQPHSFVVYLNNYPLSSPIHGHNAGHHTVFQVYCRPPHYAVLQAITRCCTVLHCTVGSQMWIGRPISAIHSPNYSRVTGGVMPKLAEVSQRQPTHPLTHYLARLVVTSPSVRFHLKAQNIIWRVGGGGDATKANWATVTAT